MSDPPQEEAQNQQLVTLTLSAAWYAVLIAELQWSANVSSGYSHSKENCIILWRHCLEEGGAKVERE